MSNHLAIATVTAALAQVAHSSAQSAVGGVGLRLGRPAAPSAGEGGRRLHVYLYQVTPNAALRNIDLPSRDGEGRLTRRPQAALDLHYLLSFYGDDQVLEPDRMLGAVVRDLHARPQLTRQLIQDVIDGRAELEGADLASAVELVRFTPSTLSLEDLSRLWSVMVQTPHALSMPYLATVVVLDALETAPTALPVLRRGQDDGGVDTRLGGLPQLQGYWAGNAASLVHRPRLPSLPAARLGDRLLLQGAHLAGDSVTLHWSHPALEAPLATEVGPEDLSATELALSLPHPADDWAAGIFSVTAHIVRNGQALVSNALPVVLAPRIDSIAPNPAPRVNGSVTLTVQCQPPVLPTQTAWLMLAARQIAAPPRDDPSDTLIFVIDDAPALQQQPVRLRVDGIDSLPFKYDDTTGGFVFDDAQRVSLT